MEKMIIIGDCREQMKKLIADGVKAQTGLALHY